MALNWPVNLNRKQDWPQVYVHIVPKCQQSFNLLKHISGCTKMHKIWLLKKISRPHGPPPPTLGHGMDSKYPLVLKHMMDVVVVSSNTQRQWHLIWCSKFYLISSLSSLQWSGICLPSVCISHPTQSPTADILQTVKDSLQKFQIAWWNAGSAAITIKISKVQQMEEWSSLAISL